MATTRFVALPTCAICHDDSEELRLEYVSTFCGHIFHLKCIQDWENSQRRNGSSMRCPTCNAPNGNYSSSYDSYHGVASYIVSPSGSSSSMSSKKYIKLHSLSEKAENAQATKDLQNLKISQSSLEKTVGRLDEKIGSQNEMIKSILSAVVTGPQSLKEDLKTFKTDLAALKKLVKTLSEDQSKARESEKINDKRNFENFSNHLRSDISGLNKKLADIGSLRNQIKDLESIKLILKGTNNKLIVDLAVKNRNLNELVLENKKLKSDIQYLKSNKDNSETLEQLHLTVRREIRQELSKYFGDGVFDQGYQKNSAIENRKVDRTNNTVKSSSSSSSTNTHENDTRNFYSKNNNNRANNQNPNLNHQFRNLEFNLYQNLKKFEATEDTRFKSLADQIRCQTQFINKFIQKNEAITINKPLSKDNSKRGRKLKFGSVEKSHDLIREENEKPEPKLESVEKLRSPIREENKKREPKLESAEKSHDPIKEEMKNEAIESQKEFGDEKSLLEKPQWEKKEYFTGNEDSDSLYYTSMWFEYIDH